MTKAIIFDLDNTICNSSQIVRQILDDSYRDFAKFFPHVSKEKFMSANDEGVKYLLDNPKIPIYSAEIRIWYYILERLDLKFKPSVIYKLHDGLLSKEIKNITLFEGIRKLFLFLKRRGVKIAILSNGSFVSKVRKLRKLKIDHYIDYLVSSDLAMADKPSADSFRYILAKMGLRPSEVVYIGDHIDIDIKPAEKLGMQTILYMPSYKRYDAEKMEEVEYKITSYKQAFDLLRKLGVK